MCNSNCNRSFCWWEWSWIRHNGSHPNIENTLCYTPWTITCHLVLIFSHHVYHRTVLTGLWLPYWTYALSRYLAATLCSHTFLIRMMFARSHDHHCPALHDSPPYYILRMWVSSISLLTNSFAAYYTYDCASVSTLLRCCADSFCLRVPILYDDSYFNRFT